MANFPFNIPWLTESIKKCSIKYLIERYLGHYFSGQLDLSQLNIELFNGKGSIDHIPLDVNTINQEISSLAFPIKLNNGFVERIELSVPWSSLSKDSCHVHLEGIGLDFTKLDKIPNNSPDVTASSVFSKSLTESSKEIAEDIVHERDESENFDGLEKFAKLINSVIRRFKLSATKTNIKFILPSTNSEIKIYIGSMNCEEEEISLDSNENNENVNFSDVMTKRIALEGIELFINGTLVTKLYGKHTVKLRFDKDRLDTEAYLGSYIFAILNSEQLKVLKDFFTFEISNVTKNEVQKDSEPMTPQDYKKIQELMHDLNKTSEPYDVMTKSIINKNWTSDGDDSDESTTIQDSGHFKPFTHNKKTFVGSCESLQTQLFSCNLKIPGLMLCLISNDCDSKGPIFNDMPMIDSLQTFIGINSFLNEMLAQFDHLRILASNLCLELTNDSLQFSCINVSADEFHDETLSNILFVKDGDCEQIVPSVKINLSENKMNIDLASSIIKLDLTMIERHYNIFKVFIPTKKSSDDILTKNSSDDFITIHIACKNIETELFFPIPDLRPNRQELSGLHDETLNIVFGDIKVTINKASVELVCCSLEADIKLNDRSRKVFSSKSASPDISLTLSFLESNIVETIDEKRILAEATSMYESTNYIAASTINRNKTNSAFQIKRKLFAEEDNNSGHEQIVTPGDRDHLLKYLDFNKGAAKVFVCLSLAQGDIFIEDKSMLELIYNRFVNDLALWTPYFPNKTNNHNYETMIESSSTAIYHSTIDTSFANGYTSGSFFNPQNETTNYSSFPACVSQPQFFSCKYPMNTSCDSETSFHSIYENDQNSEMTNTVVDTLPQKAPSNEFVFELDIATLNAKFNTGKEAKHANNLFSQNFHLGLVLGPENDPSTVVCISMDNMIMKHLDKHVLVGNSYMKPSGSALNIALEIKRENDRLKKIKLALQLKRALMYGIDLPIFDELYDFAMLVDDDILGYVCPKVILELHIDIAQSGISFDLLKERTTLLHVEDVYLTSMVIENTSQTILRFLIEEALLCFKRNNVCQDTMKSFIPVIDTGIIDLSLKISKNGKLELKITNNEINVKVCPDSLASLAQFLQLFAAQLVNENELKTQTKISPNKNDDIFVRKKTRNGSDLIADALSECSNNQQSENITNLQQNQKLVAFSDDDDEDENEDEDDNNDDIEMNGDVNKNNVCQNCDSPKIDESTFWMLGDDDVGTGINFSKEPKIRQLIGENLRIVENHFKVSNHNIIPEISPSTVMRYLLERLSLKFSLFGGRDFDDVPTEEMEEHLSMQDKLDVVSQANISIRSGKSSYRVRFLKSSGLWESIDLVNRGEKGEIAGESTHHFKASGGRNRKNDICVELKLNRIKTLFENFDSQHSMAWRFLLFIQEIQIVDKVNSSKIKTILYEYVSESIPRRKNSNMFSIRMTCHRNFMDKNEECNLNVSLKPLRINIDQDTLMFLIEFITNTNEILTAKLEQIIEEESLNSGKSYDLSSLINEDNMNNHTTGGLLDDKLDDDSDMNSNVDSDLSRSPPTSFSTERVRRTSTSSSSSTNDKIFIKSFVFAPDVPIRLDYHGRHIDLKQGALPGIFLGLAHLNQSELHLKRLVNKHGLLGLDKVIAYAIEEWARDIKRNQLPSILGGVGPMHSFIQLFQGIRDLFWMPIDQYRKDQRIVRGLQRGAHAFSVSTAMATLELTNRFVSLIQTTAQFAHDVVTPPVQTGAYRSVGGQLSTFHNSQPRDFREGVTVAYTVMREGLHDTVRGVTNAGLVSDDMSTVIGEVVRQIPSTLVRPFIHVSQATSSMLVGMRNQLTPEARKDDHEKWKNANER